MLRGAYAHTPSEESGRWHLLEDHLRAVAELAGTYGAPLGLRALTFLAGALHDVGKASPEFQNYLQAAQLGHPRPRGSVDHKSAGALAAAAIVGPLAIPILGHHGGLPSAAQVRRLVGVAREESGLPSLEDFEIRDYIQPGVIEAALAEFAQFRSPLEAESAIRLIFSCLVDADSVDTEAHMQPQKAMYRGGAPDLATLNEALTSAQSELIANAPDSVVNRVRRRVYEDCVCAASSPQGVFSLTVPTGGGKTRSSLAFALQHAVRHNLEHVIYVAPYTTIIEQTCDVFREVLRDDRAVLEHHSTVNEPASGEENRWTTLAAENWDAPVVVTTTVQFFESLFGNRPAQCRKVHRIARSVVVLDEVQTLPERYLAPIISYLQELVGRYGTSIVLCTATQPALGEADHMLSGFRSVREISSDPEADFAMLERVEYQIDREPTTWTEIADDMREHEQCLAILNTKQDAVALLDALDDPTALHLSTRLCPEHRRIILHDIERRLSTGSPCRVVSTQVVEAGVDLDFPVVFRAFGPLDRIVQAAGRCNREGTRPLGLMRVFDPAHGGQPSGAYRTAADHARMWLRRGDLDLCDPGTFPAYFRDVYADVDTDAKGIQALREALDFPRVAESLRIIEEDTVPVLVPFDLEAVESVCSEARSAARLTRSLWRRAQRHSVALRRHDFERGLAEGLAYEVVPSTGLYRWTGEYDVIRGLTGGGPDPADLIQ